MDFIVDGDPRSCLQWTYDYFHGEWPFRGRVVDLSNSGSVSFEEYVPQVRTFFDSASGLVILLLLSLITGGVFFFAYLLYTEVFKDRVRGVAEAYATYEGPNTTRLTVSSNKRKYAKILERWVRDELHGKRASL